MTDGRLSEREPPDCTMEIKVFKNGDVGKASDKN